MSEYTPLDVARWSNREAGANSAKTKGPFGPQVLRGLPFDINPICFDSDCKDVLEIPIQASARWIIIAHGLSETRLLEGEPPGQTVARYRFHFPGTEPLVVPIRERFEIAFIPPTIGLQYWGQSPFLAVPDRFDSLMAREAGPWEQTGFRQTEVNSAWPERFFLWAWENPYPDREVACLSIEPLGCAFQLGGITLSSLAEDPFGREPGRPVKITLTNAAQADQPFNLSLEVDRGVATYPYPLPRQDREAFLADSFRGWGQEYSSHNSPAYAQIAGLDSATVRLKSGTDEIAQVRWGDVLANGAVQAPQARVELVDRGKNWVHVAVIDDETGKPLACRVHFRSPEGIPYQPHGHHDHLMSDMGTWHLDVGGDVRLGHITYAYIDGRCQGWLPRGEVLVDVACGFEYAPLRTSVQIQPGQRELLLRLKRWTNQNMEGWYSGDTHVHFLSTPGAHLEAQGEGLNVVNLLQSQWGHLFTNTEDFVGRPVSSPDGRTIVYASQENRQHLLGHLSLLGLKQPVMPWCSDGPDEAELGGSLETTLSYWADACHGQGGTVIIPHMPMPNGEPAALIATARADAVEMLAQGPFFHHEYYRYLNGGYRLPLVGGTDKMTAEVPVGLYRTYVHIPPDEEFNFENWCKHLRLGQTFLSSGPILRFTVNGAQIGNMLHLPGNGGTVEVQAEAHSIFPIHTLQIMQEGHIVASVDEPRGTDRLVLKTHLRLDHHTWLAARVGDPADSRAVPHFDIWRRGIMAHTSPTYVAVGSEWWMSNTDTAQYMLTLLHGGLEYIRQRAIYHNHGTVTHFHGE
ncbi:MAG TPA: CehA/McbA family metallohydrolase, partial [Aggregatilineaceae bacterium]|nr:CehA/McbA family metallohydrolase [Aggregatilineaceae bacterium]